MNAPSGRYNEVNMQQSLVKYLLEVRLAAAACVNGIVLGDGEREGLVVKKVALLLLVCLTVSSLATAELDLNVFKSSGEYLVADAGDSFVQEPEFAIPSADSSVNLGIAFGVTQNQINQSVFLPTLVALLFFYPEDFEAIKAIHIVLTDAKWEEREYDVLLAEPIYQNVTANATSGSTTIFESLSYVLMVGSELKSILESMPSNQETYFVFQTESNKLLYFQITDEIEEAFFSFWEDFSKAGGLKDKELAVVDYFCPLKRIT